MTASSSDRPDRAVTVQRAVVRVLLGLLVASTVLVAVMAARSAIDVHPDEALHVSAAEYFREHWLPPAVGGPGTAGTYSRWGMSYVDEADAVYWLLGRAIAVGEALGLPPGLSMRLFQVALYLVLVTWIIVRSSAFSPALGFLLLTPQVWYVFSYINGDALPFLLLTGLVLELAWEESGIRAYLRGASARATASVWTFGVLLGLLLLSKRNYLVAVGFLGFAVLWLWHDVVSWKRVAMPVTIALAIALPWVGYHAWVNDFQTGARVMEHLEATAAPELKLSLAARPGAFFFIGLRTKGIPWWALFTHLDWGGITFRSFSGAYGWMRWWAPPWGYRAFGVLDALLLAILAGPVLRRGPRNARILLGAVAIFAGLVVAQSVYRSWTLDFQAQGRYLFPLLPMLFFYWRQCEAPRLRTPALLTSACLGVLSLLSFALVGLLILA